MSNLEIMGALASLLGAGLGAAGIVVTVVQVRKAKNAVEAAREATRDALDRMARDQLRHSAAECSWLLEALRDACGGENWPTALARVSQLRRQLPMVFKNPRIAGRAAPLYLAEVVDDVNLIARSIESMLRAAREPKLSLSNFAALDRHALKFAQLLAELQYGGSEPN